CSASPVCCGVFGMHPPQPADGRRPRPRSADPKHLQCYQCRACFGSLRTASNASSFRRGRRRYDMSAAVATRPRFRVRPVRVTMERREAWHGRCCAAEVHMTRTTILLLGVVASGALATGCGTFSVRRAALVPHQQPTQRSGQPMGAYRAEVALGAASVVELAEPREADGANAGVHIPQTQLNAGLRLRASSNFDVGFLWDYGLERG